MINNIFFIFDPNTSILFQINWISTLINLLILPSSYWLLNSRFNKLIKIIFLILNNEINLILKLKFNSFNSLFFINIFMLIFFNNFIGLFPYIFTRTRHIVFAFSFSLPFWIRLILIRWTKFYKNSFAHLIPQGTPFILIPFIVIIETIRNFIRPLTLSIRLTANIIAGHLLLTLLGNTGTRLSLIIINLLIFTQLLLLVLESAVAVIQSYVFSILRTLYSREVN